VRHVPTLLSFWRELFHLQRMPSVVLILMLLLAGGFLGSRIALQLRIPHSVFLVVLGVASGIFLRDHDPALWLATESLNRIFPELVLYILLPPLIFESAYNLDFSLLKKDIFPLGALAVVALVLSTILIGGGLHLFFGFHLMASLTFGALISATDPVSVISLFKEVGAPKRLANLIEGESLLNDGTAIVLFRTLLFATTASTLGRDLFFTGTLEFFHVAVGGVIVGFIFAFLISVAIRLVSHSGAAQLGLTVSGAYITFVVADHVLGLSGVIATMAVGLFLGGRARLDLNRDALEGIKPLWEFLALAANVLVFFAVGLIVDTSLLAQSVKYIPLTLTLVYFARALSVGATIPLVNRFKLARPISFPYQVVLFWGGLRGGLALGLVLILPPSFPHRDLFVALATSIVFSTLFLNALTTGKVLRILGLRQLDQGDEGRYRAALKRVRKSVIQLLSSATQAGILSEELVWEKKLPGNSITDLQTEKDSDTVFSIAALLFFERRQYELMLRDGTISKESYKILSASVNSRLETLAREGVSGVQKDISLFDDSDRPKIKFRFKRSMLAQLRIRLECLLTIRVCLEDIKNTELAEVAKETTRLWIDLVNSDLDKFYQGYPHYVAPLHTLFVANRIRSHSATTFREFLDSSIINNAVYKKALSEVDRLYAEAEKGAERLMRPSPAYLLARIVWLKTLPKVAIRNLSDLGRKRVCEVPNALIERNSRRRCLYVVVAGILRGTDSDTSGDRKTAAKLYFTGDVLGERQLLFNEPWGETIVALMPTEVWELEIETFESFLHSYPLARARIFSQDRPRGEA
jgi:CPA1 family monovalent cation:H+ antiporter